MGKSKVLAVVGLAVLVGAAWSLVAGPDGRQQIRIVGSSTVYPFAAIVAETFGDLGEYRTPIIEATGTGGGFKLFCAGVGEAYPDFANASRAIKPSEVAQCAKHGIHDIIEFKIGYDAIVLANSIDSTRYHLTKEHIFKALAKQVAIGGALVDNPYQRWNEVDASLPDVAIEVYGPPPTSGTRDAFVELVMEEACKDLPAFVAAYPDEKNRQKTCHLIREDGRYIESGENDNLIIQKLNANKDALGIFGFSFLEENGSVVQGSIIEGSTPNFENVSTGTYTVSRPLFMYGKGEHLSVIAGMRAFIAELVSEDAIGEEGYLVEKGLVPLNAEELLAIQAVGRNAGEEGGYVTHR